MFEKMGKQQDVLQEAALDQQQTVQEQVRKFQDPMKEKIEEYKKAHPEALQDCDFAFFMKTLKKMSDSSKIKAAKNAFDEMRQWIPGTETWNIGKVYLDEDHSIAFTLRKEGEALTVEELWEQLKPIDKRVPVKSTVPLKLVFNETRSVKITDLYAHSLVTDKWAGLPVDLVLCYTEKKAAKTATPAPKED